MVWLCGWDEWTINSIISAFKKIRVLEESVMRRGRPAIEASKEILIKTINKQEKRELKTLADDFGLLHREDVQQIIENCKSYSEGQQKIMRVYTAVYMH